MDNVFHQTDETFYETQYSKGFPNHPSASAPNVRPASANDGGLQMKRLLENERMKPKEQQYRERWHQLHRSQNEPVGGQKFLHTVDSLTSVKDLTHGAKSKVESNFSNILFPGYDADSSNRARRGRIQTDDIGDAKRTTVTHGKRTYSDRSGDCLWNIFNHEAASSSSSFLTANTGREKNVANLPAAGRRLERCPSAPGRRYDMITQEAEHRDAPAIHKALQYLHKLRSFLSHSGAVQSTRKELQQIVLDGTEQNFDWNGVLLKYIGMTGSLDYEVLKPLFQKLNIDIGSYEGFVKFLDMLDSEISLSLVELGKCMQQATSDEEKLQ